MLMYQGKGDAYVILECRVDLDQIVAIPNSFRRNPFLATNSSASVGSTGNRRCTRGNTQADQRPQERKSFSKFHPNLRRTGAR